MRRRWGQGRSLPYRVDVFFFFFMQSVGEVVSPGLGLGRGPGLVVTCKSVEGGWVGGKSVCIASELSAAGSPQPHGSTILMTTAKAASARRRGSPSVMGARHHQNHHLLLSVHEALWPRSPSPFRSRRRSAGRVPPPPPQTTALVLLPTAAWLGQPGCRVPVGPT